VADVEHDVDVLFVFEVAIEADDELVGERAMNFDFTRELLSRFRSGKVCFGNHLESPSFSLVFFCLDWLELSHFVALGEASLAEEAASQVSDDLALFSGVVRVLEFALLLDDLKKEKVMPSVTETRLAFAGNCKSWERAQYLPRGNCSCQCGSPCAAAAE
jgi:hypothetical protein